MVDLAEFSKICVSNDSGNSGEHKMSPENESLTPYLEEMSPEKDKMSPGNRDDASIKSNSSGDTGHSGVIPYISKEEVDKTKDDVKETEGSETDKMIGFREPFHYCRQHPHVQNIHREEIDHHIRYSKEHVGE